MYKFELVPEAKTKVENTVIASQAKVWFKIYRNGQSLPMKRAMFYDHNFHVDSEDDHSSKITNRSILFNREGYCWTLTDAESQLLQMLKEKLPSYVRGLVQRMYPDKTYVDLMTGQQVEHSVTVEYQFIDQVTKVEEKETVVPAHIVFTSCALVDKPVSASFDGLTITYDPAAVVPNGYCFSRFGKIDLRCGPNHLSLQSLREKFSDQVIEGAFRQLVLELAKVDQLQKTPGWTAKQVLELE